VMEVALLNAGNVEITNEMVLKYVMMEYLMDLVVLMIVVG